MATARLHKWTHEELSELFYEALMRDHRSEDYDADKLRDAARWASLGALRTFR